MNLKATFKLIRALLTLSLSCSKFAVCQTPVVLHLKSISLLINITPSNIDNKKPAPFLAKKLVIS